LVANEYGTLNPTDGGRAWRSSLSFNYRATLGDGQLSASSFFIDNQLHLWNDFPTIWWIRYTAIRRTSSRIAVRSVAERIIRYRFRLVR
jgi:hypothetical protein